MNSSQPTAKYQVQQLGAGFLAIGNWYWCRLGADGFPSEPISAHGPYAFHFLAVHAAQQATDAST